MHIRNSILAGEILFLLEKVSGSVRINEIETMMQTEKTDTYLAVARLLSEGLIELIKEPERSAIALTKIDEKYESNYFENERTELLVAV